MAQFRSRLLRAGLAPVLLAASTLVFYWEIALPYRILADYDVWTYFYPLRSYAAEALRGGRFPLWNPDLFLGAPFFANPQTSLLYPGTLLFYALPVSYAYSLSVLLHVFLTGILTYAFLRVAFEIGRPGALIGAAAFAFGGSVSAQVGHISQLSATPWLPAAALCADRAFRTHSWRWVGVGGLVLGIQLLAGHAQITYMTALVVGLLLLGRALEATFGSARREHAQGLAYHLMKSGARGVGIGLGMGVLAGGLAAVQLLPAWELSLESIRSGGLSYQEATAFSLPPRLLPRSLLPGYWAPGFSEFMGYVGAGPLLLAALGLALGRPGPTTYAATLATVGLVLALGAANPLYPWLYEAVPGLDLFRVPARWLLVFSFGAAILAALAVNRLLAHRPVPLGRRRAAAVFALAAALAAGSLPFLAGTSGRIVVLWLSSAVGMALLALLALRSLRARPAVGAALVLAGLVDLRLAALDLPQRHPVPAEAADSHRAVPTYLAERLRGRTLSIAPTEYEVEDHAELARRYPDLDPLSAFHFKTALKLDEVMSANVPLRYGLSTVDGYDGGVLPLRRYLDIASLLVPREAIRPDGMLRTRLAAVPEAPLLEFFGVEAVIANQVQDVELAGVRFDVATARTLRLGDRLRVDLPDALEIQAVAVLSSSAAAGLPPDEVGTISLFRIDGSAETLPLRTGEHVFAERAPGPVSAPHPSAGPPPTGLRDTAVTISVPPGQPVAAIQWEWTAPVPWTLRAATLLRSDGEQSALVLQPGLRRTLFPVLKIYERDPPPRESLLIPQARALEDAAAVEAIRADPATALRQVLLLAPDPPPASARGDGRARFLRQSGPPEQITYRRVEGDGSGYLLVHDAWFPGWRAWVDGQEAPVYRANGLFKALWVPASTQEVTLQYEPASVRWGAAISAFALVIALALAASRTVRALRIRPPRV